MYNLQEDPGSDYKLAVGEPNPNISQQDQHFSPTTLPIFQTLVKMFPVAVKVQKIHFRLLNRNYRQRVIDLALAGPNATITP